MQMSPLQWLFLTVLSVLWGGSFFFVSVAVKEVPVLTLVLARVALAALVLLPVVFARGLKLPTTLAAWQPFAVMAVLNNVLPFTLIAVGQKEIAGGLASVLNATTPLWSVLLAHAFTADEKLTANRLAGVLIGIGGVAVLIGPAALFGQSAGLFGMVCVLGGALSYAVSGLWGRRLKAYPPLLTACCQLLCSTALLLPLASLWDRPWTLPPPGSATVGAMLGLAVLSTALAYIVFFHIMAVSGATNVLLVTLLIPLSAILLGTSLLGETLLDRHIAGALVIGAALLVIDGRVFRPWRRRPAA